MLKYQYYCLFIHMVSLVTYYVLYFIYDCTVLHCTVNPGNLENQTYIESLTLQGVSQVDERLAKAGIGVEFDPSSGKIEFRNTIPTATAAAAAGGPCLSHLSAAADTKQSSRPSQQQGNTSTGALGLGGGQKDMDALEFM